MDVIKSILFQLLDSDTSLGNIPSLSECHNEDLDQSLYGICFSSKEGSISYANKAFMQSMESIAAHKKSNPTATLAKIIKSTVFFPINCALIETPEENYLVCVTNANEDGNSSHLVTIYGITDLMNDWTEADFEKMLKLIVKCRKEYLDDEFIFDNIFDLLTVSNKNGVLIKTNSAIEEQFGLKRELAIGTNVRDLEKNAILSKSVTREVLDKGTPCTLVQDTKTGHRLLVTSTPVYDQNGELYKIFNISKDVTSITTLESKLQEAEELIREYEKQSIYTETNNKIITSNITMQHALNTVMQITEVDSTVLIEGETGVGKDVMAKQIHDTSINKNGPFVKVNCGAIPDSLIESELFGYEKGAFTGALNQGKPGLIAAAEGGTLLLDEIGELPLNMQVKLLDLIQTKSYYTIGSVKPMTANIRIIAATNRNLAKMVESGQFREDLYYRLNVVPLYIPPLRERRSEIPHLTHEFLKRFNEKYHKNKHFSRDAMAILTNAPWPGNIRELENLIERLVVTTPSSVISADNLPESVRKNTATVDAIEIKINKIIPLKEAQQEMENAMFEKALELFPNKSVAADVLGIHRTTFSRKINKPEE